MDGRHTHVRALLAARGAAAIPHPGGTLLAHLERVARRLGELGCDDGVQLAGLAHAAYGTDGFDTALLTLDERAVLVSACGAEVEHLVYLYGACDRSASWPALTQTGLVHDRWTSQAVRLSGQDLGRFVDLSTVNEVDVLEQAPGAAARYGAALRAAFQSWEGCGSPQVTADAYRVLDGRVDSSRSPCPDPKGGEGH